MGDRLRDPLARATRSFVRTNGIRMAVTEQGEGPAVVLCHGFPEIGYSFRHQVPALAAAGYRAIAPDQRGYGETDAPAAAEDYDIHHLAGDLVGLLDTLGLERAVFVGHDWGGIIAWQMPLLHPSRVAGVIGVNMPAFPRPPAPPLSIFRAMFGENYYVVHFQQPGVADVGLGRDVRRVFTQLMRRAVPFESIAARMAQPGFRVPNMVEMVWGDEPPGEPLLDDAELDVYERAFARSGFTGPINWYRNFDRNWETTAHLEGRHIEVPSLMVSADWDPVLRPEMTAAMPSFVNDLELVTIPECGHWTQQEKPDELNRVMVDWLHRRFPPDRP
jgi:pimeloyl-ACP methyl ester carboxylesterase